MRLILCLVLLAFSLIGCRQPYGEMYAWGDDWYTLDPAKADPFFEKLKSKLAAEGLLLSNPPPPSLMATAGMQPSENDQLYWFQGSYRGSPSFKIKLLRSGPHHETFHLMYCWEILSYSDPNKDMEDRTRELHEELRNWVKAGGIATLPPGPDPGEK